MTTPSEDGHPPALSWNLAADGYGAFLMPWFRRYAADALAMSGIGGSRASLLDVGAGPGTLSLLAAELGLRVTALDFAVRMLAELRARAVTRGLGRLATVLGDGQSLPFASSSFDACFSIFAVVFFPDPLRGLGEMRRVLRPGGVVAITSWQLLEDTPFLAELIAATAAEETSFSFFLEDELSRASELQEALARSGFLDVAVRPTSHTMECSSLEEALAGIARSTPPFIMLRRKLGEDAWQPLWTAVQRRLATRFGDGPQSLCYPAWLATATNGSPDRRLST